MPKVNMKNNRKKTVQIANTPEDITAICVELQQLQRYRTVILKSRIMQSNRLKSIVAGSIGYTSGMSEKERMRKMAEASVLIKQVSDGEDVKNPMTPIIKTTLIGIDAFDHNKDQIEKEMVTMVRRLPAGEKLSGWIRDKSRRGFGELFLAIVIGETGDLHNYSNPSKLWKRMGCSPWCFDGKTKMGATWRSGREGKLPASEWESFGYSPRRRSISYLIGESIVKLNGDGPYRTYYDEKKADARKRHPEWSDLRCHRHGMLLATKRLLLDLWKFWRDQ